MIIKTYHPSGIHCFSYDSILFERVEDKIRSVYKLRVPFKLFYKDNEGDWVTLSCDDDVSFAIATSHASKILRIKVVAIGDEAESFMNDPTMKEEICTLAKTVIDKPQFNDLVKQMMPLVIAAMYDSNRAPTIDITQQKSEAAFSPNSPTTSFIKERKQEKMDTKAAIDELRNEMKGLGFVNSDPEVEKSVTKNGDDDEDSFVFLESPARTEKSRKSIADILGELGFHDTKRNQKLILQFEGDIDRIIDALLSS